MLLSFMEASSAQLSTGTLQTNSRMTPVGHPVLLNYMCIAASQVLLQLGPTPEFVDLNKRKVQYTHTP